VQLQLSLEQSLLQLSSRDPNLAADWLAYVEPRLELPGVSLVLVQGEGNASTAEFGFGRQGDQLFDIAV
jgi:hypothetical protein